MESFFSDFMGGVQEGNLSAANTALMKELGNLVANNRCDFVDLLNESGVPASESMSDLELITLWTENVGNNKELAMGSSILINMQTQSSGADGEEVSSEGVKYGYYVLRHNFAPENDYYSNGAGPIGAIAAALGQGAQLGTKIAEGQQKKKYGAQDIAAKKAEARTEIAKQALAQRQAQIEAAAKKEQSTAQTKKTIIIVGGFVLGLVVIAGIIYAVKKRKA
jgi:hypothetical protein